MEYYCEKDNRQADISKGCRHPNDFCQHRQACLIYFLEQEEKRNSKIRTEKGVETDERRGNDG